MKVLRINCGGVHELVMWKQIGDEKLAKTADAQKVEGKRRRGRPTLRWGIALKVT